MPLSRIKPNPENSGLESIGPSEYAFKEQKFDFENFWA